MNTDLSKIELTWKKNGGHVEMDINIPPDVKAQVVLGENQHSCACGTWHFETEV